jgi:hypothetical protein
VRCKPDLLASLIARSHSNRTGVCKAQGHCFERPPHAHSRRSGSPSAKASPHSPHPNAQTISLTQDIHVSMKVL